MGMVNDRRDHLDLLVGACYEFSFYCMDFRLLNSFVHLLLALFLAQKWIVFLDQRAVKRKGCASRELDFEEVYALEQRM